MEIDIIKEVRAKLLKMSLGWTTHSARSYDTAIVELDSFLDDLQFKIDKQNSKDTK